ncbi:precursor of CEP9-like [Hibiscus syriacus]|nr:precursor of CEP9-like [Hibiscus syriacus]
MHKFAVFLLITFHLVLSVEGRLLKSLSKNDSKQVLPPPTPTKTSDSVEGYEEDFRPTTPGNSPGAGHSFAGDDEAIVEQKPGKHSIEGDKDDFRPTTPGNSPGAGHAFQEDDEDIERKAGSFSMQGNGKHSIAGAKKDFRPTNPGHSPGVGHVYPSQNSEPNA